MAKIWSGPQQLDWECYVGDKNIEVFEVTAGDPIDLTGATIEAQARKIATDPVIALSAVITPVEPGLGTFSVEWDGEELRNLVHENGEALSWQGVWDLQVTMSGETLPRTLVRGAFIATHDVTRGAGIP